MLFVVLSLISMLFCGCNKKEESTETEETVSSVEKTQTAAVYAENYKTDDELENELLQSVVITVTDVRDGDNGSKIGSVMVSLPDLTKIYNAHKDEFKDDDTGSKIKAIIRDNLNEFSTDSTFEAEVVEENGQWKLADKTELNGLIADTVDNYLKAVLKDIQMDDITINIDGEGFGE